MVCSDEDAAHLRLNALHPLRHGFRRVQRALVRLAARIADEARAAADDGNGAVPMLLHAAQRHERQQVADVQAVRRRVKAAIKGLLRVQGFLQGIQVAALLQQAAPFQVGDQVGGH
jgi:hypothetical protein